VSVLDLILNRDPQVRLLWAGHCDCTPERRLICSAYAYQGARYLYLPPMNGRHATTGARVKTEPLARRLEPGATFARIVDCSRCRSHYAVSSAPLASAFVAIRLGLPAGNPFEDNEHVTTLKVPIDGAAEVLSGLFLTPLDRPTFGRTRPS
jgi:hypothetical protein